MTDPNVTKLLVAISTLCKVLGVALAMHGMGSSPVSFWLQIIGGSVMIVGPAIWDVWMAIVGIRKARAVGVQAGINLTASGEAIDHAGNQISIFAPGATPPKPVTLETADAIVQKFGPTTPPAKA